MSVNNKELEVKISKLLSQNALILYDQNGEAIKFSYQRHICSEINEIPGNSLKNRIFNSIILALNLWDFWEIHIRNSKYPYRWYGCVQIEERWLKLAEDTPPYVIFNSESPTKIKEFSIFKNVDIGEFSLDIEKIEIFKLKKMIIKKAIFEEDNSTVWRICVS